MGTTSEQVITTAKGGLSKYLTAQNVKIGSLVLLVFVVAFLLYKSFAPSVDMTKMKALQTQNDQLKTDLAVAIEKSDAKIKELNGKLAISSATVTKLKIKLKESEGRYANVQKPKDRTETVGRLRHFAPSAK